MRKAVLASMPEAIVHQATDVSNVSDLKHFDRTFAQTNRLRTEGIDTLLAAAREAGVRGFVARRYGSARYVREGGWVKNEDDPLDPTPVPSAPESQVAMRYVDEAVPEASGIALRYSPSTSTSRAAC